jgi:hypothetical protein
MRRRRIKLKTNIAIAVLISSAAFLTPAHATTVLLTTTLPTGTLTTSANLYLSNPPTYTGINNGFIIASGFDGIFQGATPAAPNYGSKSSTEQLDVGSQGLGLNNSTDRGDIAVTDGIVLDFANVKASLPTGGGTIASVTINLYEDASGPADYMVWGMSNANGTGTATLLNPTGNSLSGPTGMLPAITTSTVYASYVVGVTNLDCAVSIESVGVTYTGVTTTGQAPEPGTFVMAGIALIGLGVTMKKRARKA